MVLGKFESDILGQGSFDEEKLRQYGFVQADDGFLHYACPLAIDGFSCRFVYDGKDFYGKVLEDDLEEEYGAFRASSLTPFAFAIGQAYQKVIEDIARAAYSYQRQYSTQANRILAHIESTYGDEREYPWNDENCIYRHKESKKWYALFMDIPESRLGRRGDAIVTALNLKADPYDISSLVGVKGIYLAYHMNKKHWITVVLDDEVSDDMVFSLLAKSHRSTIGK